MALTEVILSQLSLLTPTRKSAPVARSEEYSERSRRSRIRAKAGAADAKYPTGQATANHARDLIVGASDVDVFRRELDLMRIRMLDAAERDHEIAGDPHQASSLPIHEYAAGRDALPLTEDLVAGAVKMLERHARDVVELG